MGITRKIINQGKSIHYANSPVFVNDIIVDSAATRSAVEKELYTLNDEHYSNIPRCSCGNRTGRFRIGSICSECGTPVAEVVNNHIEPRLFIRSPNGVAPLLNITILLMLRIKFSKGNGKSTNSLSDKFDLIRYLTDTHYTVDKSKSAVSSIIYQLEKAGLNDRGYNNFVERFDEYMEVIFNLPEYKTRKNAPIDDLYYLIKECRNDIFSDTIPIVNKSLLVVESTNVGEYIDEEIVMLVDAIRMMIGIDTESCTYSDTVKQNKTARALCYIADFIYETYKNKFAPKSGIMRRLIFGSRSDYTFRTVISAITTPHRFDEVHIGWSAAINVFKYHLSNLLFKINWTPNMIEQFLNKYALEYHPLIDALFQQLISDAKNVNGIGIPILSNRNPSLTRGSIMRLFITKVKTNPSDITTSISPLTTAPQNADFDGDALNFILLLDHDMADRCALLAPEMNVFTLDGPAEPYKALDLTHPAACTLNNWVNTPMSDNQVIREGMSRFM